MKTDLTIIIAHYLSKENQLINPLLNTLKQIDEYARKQNPNVKQVSASLNGSWEVVRIYRPGGVMVEDIRPLVRLYVSIVLEKNGRLENGSRGSGGRIDYEKFLNADHWQNQVNEAIQQAEVNLESVATPAGEMDVVLGSGILVFYFMKQLGMASKEILIEKKHLPFST